jgi:hypothetical protein
MFDGRIYRAAFVPLLLVLVVAGFSLTESPAPLGSTLAPDAFDGARAFAALQALVERYPDRAPGSVGDDELADYIARVLGEPTPGSAGGGFQVSTRRIRAQTIDGVRTLTTVIAERPGLTGMSPIAIIAHRDGAARGSAAELSGTAALLELAQVFSQSETRRTIVLVSTSGGSGGYAGAGDFAREDGQRLDAAIVLGDLAGALARKPFVLPFSSVSAATPESLQRTLAAAVSQEVGTDPGAPSVSAQLAQLAFPLASGEEAPLNAAGVPAVLVQVSGERGPSPEEPVSATRLLNFGRAVLSATYALDEGPDVAQGSAGGVLFGHEVLGEWVVRLLTLALLLPALLVGVDALARLRRCNEPLRGGVVWVLTAALPFFACALFAILLGALGIVAAPGAQLSARSLSADASAAPAAGSAALVLVLALLVWPVLVRRLALPLRPSADGAALAVVLVLDGVALLVWIFSPVACLLLVPAIHMWLVAIGAGRRPGLRFRALRLCAILAGVFPLVLLLVFYGRELGLGALGLSESVVLAFAGGRIGLFGALLWSVAFGCLAAVVLLVPTRPAVGAVDPLEWEEISTRGPASYAGPGSLGGTESALRR